MIITDKDSQRAVKESQERLQGWKRWRVWTLCWCFILNWRHCFSLSSVESLVGYGPCRAYTCLSVSKLFQMALPGYNKSHSSGKGRNCFSFSVWVANPGCASYIWHPGPLRGAGRGASQWPSPQPPFSRSCAYFLTNFLFFWKVVGKLSEVLYSVNRQRPARFCRLKGLMFILRHVECLGI